MTKRPKSAKYRNLTRRGSVVYFEAVLDGQRVRFSTEASDWDEAAAVRDAYLRKRAERRVEAERRPTFAEVAARYLADMEAKRAAGYERAVQATTAHHKRQALRPGGPILRHLGALRLDDIGVAELGAWWDAEVVHAGRSHTTGLNLLDHVAKVIYFGRRPGWVERAHDPTRWFRAELRAEGETKLSRAARHGRRRLARDRVLSPADVGRLVAGAEALGVESLVTILLGVEGGLRRGEIAALTWGDVRWASGEDDPTRAVEVSRSDSSGRGETLTKSGKARTVHVSRRLYRALRALAAEREARATGALPAIGPRAPRVAAGERILSRGYQYLDRGLDRALRRAGLAIGCTSWQGLRATAATRLREWGISKDYCLAAIGHEGEAVAQRHYIAADWSTYREPERLAPGEVPQDLFARLCCVPRPESPHLSPHQGVADRKAPLLRALGSVRPRGVNPIDPQLSGFPQGIRHPPGPG